MSYLSDGQDLVYKQSYQIMNNSTQNCTLEILEYQISIRTRKNKLVEVTTELIGTAILITTQTFDNTRAGLYPLFDDQNNVIGTQIIFASETEKKDQKKIYELENP